MVSEQLCPTCVGIVNECTNEMHENVIKSQCYFNAKNVYENGVCVNSKAPLFTRVCRSSIYVNQVFV